MGAVANNPEQQLRALQMVSKNVREVSPKAAIHDDCFRQSDKVLATYIAVVTDVTENNIEEEPSKSWRSYFERRLFRGSQCKRFPHLEPLLALENEKHISESLQNLWIT